MTQDKPKDSQTFPSRLIILILVILGVFLWALEKIGPRFWVISGAAAVVILTWWKGQWEKRRKMQISAVSAAAALVILAGWTGWLYVSDTLEARTLANQAQAAEKSGDYVKADNLYKRLLKLRNRDSTAFWARERINSLVQSQSAYQQGLNSLKTGQIENAIVAFKRVQSGTPWYEDSQARISRLAYEKGQQALRAGQFKDAIQGFKGVAQGSPTYSDAQESIRTTKTLLTTQYVGKLNEAEKALGDGYRPARDPAKTRWGRVADASDALADVDASYLTPAQQKRYFKLRAETDRRNQAIAEIAERVTNRYLREKFAGEVETLFLDKGMDVTVTIEGRDKNVMRLKWVLWSRPLVYQWGKNVELMGKLRELGFSRIIFDTGFNQRWWYDL